MGHIILHNGQAKHTMTVDELQGVIEVDVTGDHPVVTVPEGVEVVTRKPPTA